jgi:hypothetical protein
MADEKLPTKIRYHYLKSNAFRVVHADGVFGGPTAQNMMHLAFFSERAPIPQTVDHALDVIDGTTAKVGAEVSRTARDGMVREVEVGILMTPPTAKALHTWLGDLLAKMEEAMVAAPKGAGE